MDTGSIGFYYYYFFLKFLVSVTIILLDNIFLQSDTIVFYMYIVDFIL